MGMLTGSDWKCKWIGAPWQDERASKYSGELTAAPLLRKEFFVAKPVRSARFFGTGLGYFELYVNGRKANEDVLSPNQNQLREAPRNREVARHSLADNFAEYRVFYIGIDLTPLLCEGTNALGVILGNGFYNTDCHWDEPYGSLRFFGQVLLEYQDGTSDVVVSDGTWRAAKSAIVEHDIFRGEHYDARLEHEGWSFPGFDDSGWDPVAMREPPFGRLVAQNGPADRVCERFEPVSITRRDDGTFRVLFPVEISGWVHFKGINAPAGTCISIEYICESPIGSNSYTCKGTGHECYRPLFTWFVFREVIVHGWYGDLGPENITAEAVNSDVACISRFSCSNELFNKLQAAYVRTQLDNFHGSIASDCPHRERTPYTGDGALCMPAALANFDASALYNKWLADIRGAANPDTGHVPNSAPWQPGAGGGVAWGAAIAVMPWTFYEACGDRKVLEDNFDAMLGYIRYLDTWATDDIVEKKDPTSPWQNLGDWIPAAAEIPRVIVHTWYYWRCVDIARRTASIIGRTAEAGCLAAREEAIRKAFHKRFYNEETGSYGPNGGNVFALAMGMPEERRERVVKALEGDIAAAGGHTDGGMISTAMLFSVLAENGRTDLAYEIMDKDDIPSMGNWIAKGSTTLWEYWDGAHSHNHPIFGSGFVWFYRHVAGLAPDLDKPGYRHIVVTPKMPAKLASASYSLETPYGRASVAWERKGGGLSVDVEIPVGSTASIRLPGIEREVGQGLHHFDI